MMMGELDQARVMLLLVADERFRNHFAGNTLGAMSPLEFASTIKPIEMLKRKGFGRGSLQRLAWLLYEELGPLKMPDTWAAHVPLPEPVSYREAAAETYQGHGAQPAPQIETEYDIILLDAQFGASFTELHVQFEVPNAPRMPASRAPSVVLAATVPCRRMAHGGIAGVKQLGAGASSSTGMVLGSQADEARQAAGALVAMGIEDAPVPGMPTDEEILEECRHALQNHLIAVERETARHAIIDSAPATLAGKRFKVKV